MKNKIKLIEVNYISFTLSNIIQRFTSAGISQTQISIDIPILLKI